MSPDSFPELLQDGVVLSYDAGLVISWMVNETLHTASLINKTSLLLHLKKVSLLLDLIRARVA